MPKPVINGVNNHQKLIRAAIRTIAAMQEIGERFRVLKELQLNAPKDDKAMAKLETVLVELTAALYGQKVREEVMVVEIRDGIPRVTQVSEFISLEIINHDKINTCGNKVNEV